MLGACASSLADLPSQRIEKKPDHLQVPRGGMSQLTEKLTSAVSAEGLEGRRARLQQQGEVVENHGLEGAERPRLKIKSTPIHNLLAIRATAQLVAEMEGRPECS